MDKVIVAVSGGPDSMALLDILRNDGYNCIVAHVNYNLRSSAIKDQEIVETYCLKYNLIFEFLSVKKIPKGNFQAFARKSRYDFFISLAKKYNLSDVYVAHHEDDVLETFIMQKKRKTTPQHYGIKDKIYYKQIKIIRPLLNYAKKDLINYCIKNNIDYGIDETNQKLNYKRNKIRHEIVNKMSLKEKQLMLKEIDAKNKKLEIFREKVEILYKIFLESYGCSYILKQNKENALYILRLWFENNKIYNISQNEYLNILKFIKSQRNHEYFINERYSLFKDYEKLSLVSNTGYQYNFEFDKIEYKEYEHFKIQSSGNRFEAVTVEDSDFPITIRNFKDGDKILMRYGNKKVSRWFIDNKIAPSLRRSWPVVLNKEKEIILVPKIGCNVTHYSNNPNLFVVK